MDNYTVRTVTYELYADDELKKFKDPEINYHKLYHTAPIGIE